MFAVFSYEQSLVSGILEYETLERTRVFCTEVSHDSNVPSCLFRDKQHIGQVWRFVRRVSSKSISHADVESNHY